MITPALAKLEHDRTRRFPHFRRVAAIARPRFLGAVGRNEAHHPPVGESALAPQENVGHQVRLAQEAPRARATERGHREPGRTEREHDHEPACDSHRF